VVLQTGSPPLHPLVSWDLEFFFAVICFTPFDSERCSEFDLPELVATAELDCEAVFDDVTEDDFCSTDVTWEDSDNDSSVIELLTAVEEATVLDFAFAALVTLFETSVLLEESKLDTETDAFFELAATDEDDTELFFAVALAFDITDVELFADVELKILLDSVSATEDFFEAMVETAEEDFFDDVELKILLDSVFESWLAATELATAIEDFFVATEETAEDDFFAENDFDLPMVFTALEDEVSAVSSVTSRAFFSS